MMRRPLELIAPALLAAATISAGSASAIAQSQFAQGNVGYLQEWEMKANLAKSVNGASTGYAGPIILRHVGLCSVNGVEEKSGTLELRMSPRQSSVEGTLALTDDECHFAASGTHAFSGLMKCRDGQGVPIKFSIEPMRSAGPATSRAQN